MGKSIDEYDFQKGEILLFDKELDWTSFDLVRKLRNFLCRQTGVKKLKVGHAGTLDPKATGLMIVCTGKETKNIDLIQSKEKEYIATLKLGATTPSYDLETTESETFSVEHITPELVKISLQKFLGELDQIPPLFSAVKVEGKRAYEQRYGFSSKENYNIRNRTFKVFTFRNRSSDCLQQRHIYSCSCPRSGK